MRVMRVVAVQLLASAVITAILMPVLVMAIPAMRSQAGLGTGVTAGVFAGCFGLLAISWPWRGE